MAVLVGITMIVASIAAIAFALAIPAGWMFMLLVGALHSEFGWFPRTIAFWPSVGIMLTGSVVVKSLFGTNTKS